MSMHMLPAMYTTTGKKKTKQKFKSAAHAAKAKENAENWKRLLEKYDVKPGNRKSNKTTRSSPADTVYRRDSGTDSIPSLDTGVGVAPKKDIPVYTGDAMIGIGQLHKSNAVPVFKQEDAEDLAKMRRN